MLKWFDNAYDSLIEIIPNIETLADVEITKATRKTLTDMQSLLRPLADATILIEGDSYPTLAWTVEIEYLLVQHLKNHNCKSQIANKFRDNLLEQINNRFGDPDEIVWMAALLTPSLRDSPALDGHRDNTWKLLKARYTEVKIDKPQTSSRTEEEIKVDTADTSLHALRIRYAQKKKTSNYYDIDYTEFKQYKSLPGVDAPALDWWKANATFFPRFAILARKILSIVGSSAPVERLFSTLGNAYTKKRQQLKPDTARCQVLLHENKNL
jgi:hypothetical protein